MLLLTRDKCRLGYNLLDHSLYFDVVDGCCSHAASGGRQVHVVWLRDRSVDRIGCENLYFHLTLMNDVCIASGLLWFLRPAIQSQKLGS